MAEPTPPPITAQDALAQEQAALHLPPGEATALCLSGGGIRSAAFCLGVVQGLARMGVLKQFHYLSTVSGGGYIGGYLSARLRALDWNAEALQQELKQGGNAPWLTRLRQSGNFLTPQLGLFSLDTWTGLTLYTRNLLLTWASLLPWMLLLVLCFIAYRTLVAVAGTAHLFAFAALAAGAIGLIVSTYWLCIGLPSHHRDASGAPRSSSPGPTPTPITIAFVALLWPMLLPFALGTWQNEHGGFDQRPIETFAAVKVAGLYAACVLAGYGIALSRAAEDVKGRYHSNFAPWLLATLFSALLTATGPWLLIAYVPQKSWVEVLAVAGPAWFALAMIIHAGTFMGLRRKAPVITAELDREWTARMSARIQLLSVAVALAGFPILAMPDWFIPEGNAVWTTGAWRSLLTPLLSGPAVAWLGHQAFTRMSALNELDAGWRDKAMDFGLALLAGVFLAFMLAISSAVLQSYVLGPVQQGIVGLVQEPPAPTCTAAPDPARWCLTNFYCSGSALPAPAPSCRPTPHSVPIFLMLGLQAGLALLLFVAARILCIDNNRFTLHAVYRNRLVRGFLGPARDPQNPATRRNPEPVTGFDPNDDLRLAALGLHEAGGKPRPLFPVINIAVNVTRTSNPLWAERKALSFTATPLHCGYYLPLAEPQPATAPPATYVATRHFNHSLRGETDTTPKEQQGLGLGTAITISGAAASPNSGYHSRPATAFLMTLFNVRLGLWAPNTHHVPPAPDHAPGSVAAWLGKAARAALGLLASTPHRRPALEGLNPAEQPLALLNDLTGNTSIDRSAIYLFDGGHFDNLGLYEMLRRRCTRIVVVDAAHDPDCSFADLGQSLRKAAIDLGATVSITATHIGPRKPGTENPRLLGFAVGTIDYPATDTAPAARGELLYIKPTWLADLPMDVRAYGAAEKDFPQQPTSDQWFSESQFESYRSLGTHQLQALALETGRDLTLETLFKRAEARLAATPA